MCRGLLSCDFSAEGEEELSMTLLPDGLHAEEVETLSSVCVSEGKITYVAVSGHPGGLPSEGNVLVWILVDPKHSRWKLRTVTPMSVIWDTICHALGLQRGAPPVISVLDRQDASVLYFFIQQHLVGFHLTRRLVKHSCICGHQGGTSRMVLSMGTPPIAPTQGDTNFEILRCSCCLLFCTACLLLGSAFCCIAYTSCSCCVCCSVLASFSATATAIGLVCNIICTRH